MLTLLENIRAVFNIQGRGRELFSAPYKKLRICGRNIVSMNTHGQLLRTNRSDLPTVKTTIVFTIRWCNFQYSPMHKSTFNSYYGDSDSKCDDIRSYYLKETFPTSIPGMCHMEHTLNFVHFHNYAFL